MKNSFNIDKRIEIISILSLIVFFFIINANIISYGLPFFPQEDEDAFLKGTISYISFITGIKRELSDPFFGPLINLIFTLKFLFTNPLYSKCLKSTFEYK